jgi:hypothetical protein
MALYHFKVSGEFDAAVREWENNASADKTWSNIKTFISAENAHKNKQNKLTARQFKANAMEERVEATEDLIAVLTENHTRQIKMLIKCTTDAMKEMMHLVKIKPQCNQILRMCCHLKRKRKNTMKGERAIIVVEGIHQRKRMNAGNSKRTKQLTQPIRNHQKAPEGARGPQ